MKAFLIIALLTTSLINSKPIQTLQEKLITLVDKISQTNKYCHELHALNNCTTPPAVNINLNPLESLDPEIIEGLPRELALAIVQRIHKDVDEYHKLLTYVHDLLILAEKS